MKLRIILSILIIILIHSCSSTRTISDVNNETIKSIYLASYSARRDGELSRKFALKEKPEKMELYNKKGQLIKSLKYEVDGTIYETVKNQLNENGDLIKREVFDNQNNLKYYLLIELDSIDSIKFYRTYNYKEELTSIQENQYDSLANLISIINTNTISNHTFKTVYKYDSKNQLIERKSFNSDGTIQDKRTFLYDEKGNEVESVLTRPNGDYTKFVSEYDRHNNILKDYWFDKEGIQKNLDSFSYVYNKKGNWITRKRFSNGKLGYVWERQIEYY